VEDEEAAMSLQGKRVLVVGGSSGIGLAVARGAAGEGAQVIIASSGRERVDAAAKAIPGASGVALDVRDGAAVREGLAGLGDLDHLAYTAGDWGGPRRGALADLDLDAAGQVFAVRFWGALRVIQAAHPRVRPGGSITLTDGMIAHRPQKGSSVSSAMAGAIEHLTRALAVELAPVRVNCVCPGLIRTDVWNSIPEDRREAQLERMTARQPLARAGEPGEAAEAYLHFMRAGYTTGQVLRVDGGSSVV
jgi:NAD(P)-dependent dehydrogenase (short-subunit alcohol dehydrogenase family)